MRFVFALALAASFALAAAAQEPHPIVAMVKGKLKNPDKPFVMVVTLKLKPGTQAKFEAAFAEAVKGTKTEKGNLAYDLSKSTDDDTEYTVYEKWKNLDALTEHIKTPYLEKTLAVVGELTDSPPKITVAVPVGQ